jgi:hypothetical protein
LISLPSAFHFPLPLNSRLPAANIAAAFNHSTSAKTLRDLPVIALSARPRDYGQIAQRLPQIFSRSNDETIQTV